MVSVTRLSLRETSSPTLPIGSRRARLLTSSAALRSPQTCFRLPHCLGCFAACGFPRPPALRDADYRLPPVIVLPLWIVLLLPVMVMASSESSRSASACVVISLLVLLVYIEIQARSVFSLYMVVVLLLGVLRLLMIPAFGEILRQWYAKVGASPPLSSTHYGLQRHQGAKVGKSGQLRSKSRHKGVISTLLGLLCSSTSAEPPQKSK